LGNSQKVVAGLADGDALGDWDPLADVEGAGRCGDGEAEEGSECSESELYSGCVEW
jgi:hypothetical protein